MQPPSERILLFIPMYNCERQIPRVAAQLTAEVRACLTEIIVVNNLSRDGSESAAIEAFAAIEQPRVKVLRNDENYGLGCSHKVAFNYAIANGFDYCIVLHGDDQEDIRNMAPLLLSGVHRTVDCLLGARFMPGSQIKGYSWFRRLGNHVFNVIYSCVAGRRIYDLGSGLNLYSVKALSDRGYLRHANDLTFNYHMILHSIAAGWRIRFFPIVWREDDQISNVKLLRQSLRVLAIVVDYAFCRARYLSVDHSGLPGGTYTSAVVFDSATTGVAAIC